MDLPPLEHASIEFQGDAGEDRSAGIMFRHGSGHPSTHPDLGWRTSRLSMELTHDHRHVRGGWNMSGRLYPDRMAMGGTPDDAAINVPDQVGGSNARTELPPRHVLSLLPLLCTFSFLNVYIPSMLT